MINIILTDDHQIIRDGIRALLESDPSLAIIGEASNGNELIQLLGTTVPDVVLLDINMPECDGFEATKYIKEHFPAVKVLVLSMLDNESYINKIVNTGADGYMLKNAGKNELRCAIHLVASGTPYICSSLALELLKRVQQPTSNGIPKIQVQEKNVKDLSKRELEVLELIAEGYTNAEIAEKLFTSKRTIETHRQNLLEKTKTKNTATLIRYAIQNGIIA